MKPETEQILKDKQVRITANRLLILDYFLKINHPLRISDLEAGLPWADKATIFRTLKTFEEKAVIHTIKDDERAVKYALCSGQCAVNHHQVHPHFHCDVCGKTTCLTGYTMPEVSLPKNYTAHKYSLMINGICSSCQESL